MQVYGVSLLCGVGFTMSLFIGVLAFPGAVDSPEQIEVKLGVIGGSILSALAAAVILALASRQGASVDSAGDEIPDPDDPRAE
jgi:NhaA family Na+:H+ antiporter